MKRYKLFVLLFIPLISSCFDDKGNYDYHEVAEITIEGLPELLEVVGEPNTLWPPPQSNLLWKESLQRITRTSLSPIKWN